MFLQILFTDNVKNPIKRIFKWIQELIIEN